MHVLFSGGRWARLWLWMQAGTRTVRFTPSWACVGLVDAVREGVRAWLRGQWRWRAAALAGWVFQVMLLGGGRGLISGGSRRGAVRRAVPALRMREPRRRRVCGAGRR